MLNLKSLLLSLILILTVNAQEKHKHQASSEVPELWEFHETIHQMWHEAWPAKDIALLKKLIPEIEQGYIKLKEAKLPHILHEKQDKWYDGIKRMEKTIEDYKTTATRNDSSALLDSAEELHDRFEFLVRTVRPALRELHHFHQELFMLYHHYMPEYDYEKVKNSVNELSSRMRSLSKAKLANRYHSKEEEFRRLRDELSKSVLFLEKQVSTNSSKEDITSAIEMMHTKYIELQCIFE